MINKKKLRELAKVTARRIIGKDDLRGFVRTKRRQLEQLWFQKEITLDDLSKAFTMLGVTPGRTIWLQSSWNEFYNYKGTPSSVVNLLLEMIGPEGTLAMLATPLTIDSSKVLKIDCEPVSTGMICEVFRRYKGVQRSIHQSASVIALGPQAGFLTRDHHLTETSWDPDSPFCRLMDVDALCVSAGNWRFLASLAPLHAVESLLRKEIQYFNNLFVDKTTYQWETRDGRRGEHTYYYRYGTFDAEKFGKLYPASMSKRFKISNLHFWSISARDAIHMGVHLGRQGKTMYFDPKPHAKLFLPVAKD